MFLDADMLVLCDIHELLEIREGTAVCVVKNPQLRYEWPSLMVFENEFCKRLTPEYIDHRDSKPNTLDWADPIGELPAEYNHCVGYDKPRDDAKIVHFTQGIPCFPETVDSEYGYEWMAELNMVRASEPWGAIMGNSVHAKPVLERMRRAGLAH